MSCWNCSDCCGDESDDDDATEQADDGGTNRNRNNPPGHLEMSTFQPRTNFGPRARPRIRPTIARTLSDRRNQPLPNLPIQVPQIPLDELKEITNNFGKDAHIGEGPYGKVYKGILKNGKDAAIKKLYECAQSDDAFRVQISIASSLKHPNVTALLGYCINGESRILAYEFASIGTLRELLHGNRETADPMSGLVLSWDQRVRIAAQAARGLEYLHEIVQLVHRAIKSANILIFDNFVAKIADYDLTNQSTGPIHSNRLIGGYGYSAPECALTGKQTTKSDVYSFGVVLLELLTGRKTYDNRLPLQQRSLVAWATPLLSTMVGECVDPRMDRDYPPAVVAEFAAIAALCVQHEPDFRPNMTTVRKRLEALLKEQIGPSSYHTPIDNRRPTEK
ncbi:pto-interacting protein 1-like isoform X2 [Punica granatum]|nr:pto-interacting protein 1-like isoform X2 [Punica granatum]XP_031393388.1 pto-interacting protein 1-like isoform X2 [Punica granatum]XP_031393389.1 pto-interacting protein 1-like isoform X2 [Punica granatum]